MIEVSNLTAQTLQPGQAITFEEVLHQSGCWECYSRQIPTSVKLKAPRCAQYEVFFNGNISGAAGDILRLAIAIGGQPLAETEMRVVPSGDPNSNNVSAGTYLVMTCADLDRVSVMNIGTTAIGLAPNSNLRIRRIC